MENSSGFEYLSEKMENSTVHYKDVGGEHSYINNIAISYMVIFAVTCLLGITGNGLVIWFGIFRLKKTVSLVWFLSLAVADFIFTLSLPLTITYHALDHWPFGSFMCKLHIFIYYFNKPVIALQLAILSVDRCVRVAFPQWCQNHRRRRLALTAVLIIWVVSSPFSLMFSIFSGRYDYFCYFVDPFITDLHFIIRFLCFFLVPSIVLVCSYIGITLYSRTKHVPLWSKSFTVTLVISIIFFVCYCPYNVFVFLLGIHATDFFYLAKFLEISEYLLFISSCINPIIYVLIGWEIKENFCSSFQAMLEKAFAEDDVYIGLSNREDTTVSLNLEGSSQKE